MTEPEEVALRSEPEMDIWRTYMVATPDEQAVFADAFSRILTHLTDLDR